MSAPGVGPVGERPLEELVQNASQQVVAAARDVARREVTARARQAGPGLAMVGGSAVLGALASATGTAGVILLLTRRPGASAAALGVTGAYAGVGALLAREGLVRLREAAASVPDAPAQDEQDSNVSTQKRGSAKQRTKSAAKSAQRTKPAAKPTSRPKPGAASPSSRRRSPRMQTSRNSRKAS